MSHGGIHLVNGVSDVGTMTTPSTSLRRWAFSSHCAPCLFTNGKSSAAYVKLNADDAATTPGDYTLLVPQNVTVDLSDGGRIPIKLFSAAWTTALGADIVSGRGWPLYRRERDSAMALGRLELPATGGFETWTALEAEVPGVSAGRYTGPGGSLSPLKSGAPCTLLEVTNNYDLALYVELDQVAADLTRATNNLWDYVVKPGESIDVCAGGQVWTRCAQVWVPTGAVGGVSIQGTAAKPW